MARAAAPPITVTVSGASQVRLGTPAQMTATVANTANTAVTWQVNGVTGGSASAGTISTTGLYTPPASIPGAGVVTIGAVSQANTKISGTLTETLLNPLPTVTSVTATQTNPGTSFTLEVIGTGFVQESVIQVRPAKFPTSLTTTFLSSTELQANATLVAGAATVPIDVANPAPGAATSQVVSGTVDAIKASLSSSARLLDQATFGPTLTDIQNVENIGLQAYLNQQFALPATLEPDIANPPPALCATNTIPCQQAEWWQAALTAPDQLRQRPGAGL